MSRAPVSDYIYHIEQAVSTALSYVRGMNRTDFDEDAKTQHAVVYNILVIGEATTKLLRKFPDFAAAYPDVEWTNMVGMRNQLAHGYATIDYDIVWKALEVQLPQWLGRLPGLMHAAETLDAERTDPALRN